MSHHDKMKRVPGGWVRAHDGSRHRLRSFKLDVYPVTNAAYARYLDATGAARPSWMCRPGYDEPWQPVVGVTHDDASAYAAWAGKRLPTTLEWIRAARGHDSRRYPWGDAPPCISRAHFGRGMRGRPRIVNDGTRQAGAAPWGHMDLLGNVWEWCRRGTLQGGFWGSKVMHVADGLRDRLDRKSGGFGFRCAA